MKEKVKQLEGQINLKEIALERAKASFLEKEKDLKHRIEDLERRLEVLDQNIENPQIGMCLILKRRHQFITLVSKTLVHA
ncbi:hypothetical protein HanPI659440_Chr06g0221141 [Helianthus annuus]|nr:hypothetical protein HanPI659440_Chr06g0221141 [Helianthus annuus]